MIARVWHAISPLCKARAHSAYIQGEMFRAYQRSLGNLGALLFSRVETGVADFLIVSLWDSFTSIQGLAAGRDVDELIVPLEMLDGLINLMPQVKHYEVGSLTLPRAKNEL
jgi:hypothetical protein